MSLTINELKRYSEQLKLAEIGPEGQLKLKNVRVLCVGAGGLGSSLLLYLTAAGIGKIGIIDHDHVESSNLQRQVLYHESHISFQKTLAAKEQLTALNSHVDIEIYTEKLNLKNANQIISQYDIVADCTDNFAARYLINDVCFYHNKPYVFASISGLAGQCSLFLGKEGPCFRCLFPSTPQINSLHNCAEGGVLGVVPGLLGVIQATEIIKWILGMGELLSGRLLSFDSLKMRMQHFYFTKNPECDLCVDHKNSQILERQQSCTQQSDPLLIEKAISVQDLKKLLNDEKNILLIDVRTLDEHNTYNIGGIQISLSQLAFYLQNFDPKQKIILYCQSGKRSIEAVKLLMAADFKDVKYLCGGITEW